MICQTERQLLVAAETTRYLGRRARILHVTSATCSLISPPLSLLVGFYALRLIT